MAEESVKFVDANIFLEVLLKDRKWKEARGFLEEILAGKVEGVTSDFIVFSILLELQSGKAGLMEDFVIVIGNMEYLKIAHFTAEILMGALKVMETYSLDFDDSLQVAFMRALGIKEIVSFDRDFDRVKGIKRVEPGKVE